MKMNDEKKVTNEMPVSLAPLSLKDALAALFQVKPEPKENPKKKSKQKNNEGRKL